MNEEMVDVELRLGKEMAGELLKMNKKELLNRLIVMILRNSVQDETVGQLEREKEDVERRLRKSEEYNEQARVMLEAVMERWDHYS